MGAGPALGFGRTRLVAHVPLTRATGHPSNWQLLPVRCAMLPSRALPLVALLGGLGSYAVVVDDLDHPPPANRAAASAPLGERERATHALNRLAFGPRPGDVDRVLSIGVDRWIEQQLRGGMEESEALATHLARRSFLNQSARTLARNFPPPNVLRLLRDSSVSRADSLELRRAALQGRAFVGELLSARIARAVASERQLDEVIVDFWLNHFSVFAGKNARMRYYLPQYERDAIRPHALGRFRDLLGAVAHSPAMLLYLDNVLSVADSQPTLLSRAVAERRLRRAMSRAPLADAARDRVEQLLSNRPRGLNENYARELLELHTMGVDGGYSQQDVIEVARAFTGWTVRPLRALRDGRLENDRDFVFNPAAHDAGEKLVLGHRLPHGRGERDGEEVLDIVASHPSTARHIATKLVQRFVMDSAPATLVDRVARVFRESDGDIRETLAALVGSDEFFSRSAYRAKVKSPFEVVVSAVRALGGGGGQGAPPQFDSTPFTAAVIARLGQPLYGQEAPDGYPEVSAEWMNTGAILNRINFGLMIASGRLPGAFPKGWPMYQSLASAGRAEQVERVVQAFLGGDVSPQTRQILLDGHHPMLESARDTAHGVMTDRAAEDSMGAGPRGRAGRGAATGNALLGRRGAREGVPLTSDPNLAGLDLIIGLALGAPEFQRR